VYLTPDFSKQYQAKTGRAPSGSVVSQDDFAKMAGEAGISAAGYGGATGDTGEATILNAQKSGQWVNPVTGGGAPKPQAPPAVVPPTPLPMTPEAQKLGAGLVGSAISSGQITPDQVKANASQYGVDLTKNFGANAVPGLYTPPATPNQPGTVGPGSQPLTFADWLKAQGVTLPEIGKFSFDPTEAARAAAAEADLALAPQRSTINFNAQQRIGQQRARGDALLQKLKESQAARRLFTSPVGLYTEQEQVKANEAAVHGIEDTRDQQLANLELQKANQIAAGIDKRRSTAFSQFLDQAKLTMSQRSEAMKLWVSTMQEAGKNDRASADRAVREAIAMMQEDGRNLRAADSNATANRRIDASIAENLSKQTGYVVGLDGQLVRDEQGQPIRTLDGARFDWDKQKFIISEGNKKDYQDALLEIRRQGIINDATYNEARLEIQRGELSVRNAQLLETNRHNQAMETIDASKGTSGSGSTAWKGLLNDLGRLDDPIGPYRNMPDRSKYDSAIAIIGRYQGQLTDADRTALQQLFKTRGWDKYAK
jgi:hypothetical protein